MSKKRRVVSLRFKSERTHKIKSFEPYHTWLLPDGSLWTEFFRTSHGFLLRFPGIAEFEVSTDARAVNCLPESGVPRVRAEQLYRNQVLPLVLSKLGKLIFHASSVEANGDAIAFLGESGRGKSTIAAAFAVNGYPFLSDDGLEVEELGQEHFVLPNHPSIRLWKDSHERVLASDAEKALPESYRSKSRFLAGKKLPHCHESRRLRVAYFLGDGQVQRIAFQRLSAAEALIQWTRHLFLIDVEDRALIGSQFHRIAIMSERIACYQLDYPRRYEDIPGILDAVVTHAAAAT